jgi:flagellar biosynthesis GTPase FlhF
VAYVTFGQKVPDDIVAVTPKKLAGLVLGGVDGYAENGFDESI